MRQMNCFEKRQKREPWDGSAKTSASSIAKHLGYLPLALIHAGRAIFHQLCTLHSYIPFFNFTLNNIRRKKHIEISVNEDDDGMGAFTSFDITYSGLEAQTYRSTIQSRISKDAVELINMFAFLHNSDIHLNILTKAGHNFRHPAQGQGDAIAKDATLSSTTISRRIKDITISWYLKFLQPTPVLPQLVRAIKDQSWNESRVRKAIDLLVRISLLSESSDSGIYSVHPLIHVWVRKRLSTSARALWCGAARDALVSSIKIPPLIDEADDQDFYIRILPHVYHVQQLNDEIRNQLRQNCLEASYLRRWLGITKPPAFTPMDALNTARYSRVYMECSKFSEAEKLQRLVQEFITKNIGRESPLTIPISLALSITLWHLGRPAEAQELQEGALHICRLQLGEDHPQTLKTMDALGETYWQRGWLKEARALHQSAISGMKAKSNFKREMLKAMTHLGHVHEW